MRRRFLVLSSLAVVLAACGAALENADVEATATCVESTDINSGHAVFECTIEASDSRVAGTSKQFLAPRYAAGSTERGSFTGTFIIENEDGTWYGTGFGTFSPGEAVTEAKLEGTGAYKGLVYEFESIHTSDGGGDGQGTATRTGTITTLEP